MKTAILLAIGKLLLVTAFLFSHSVKADSEVTGPDGRRILLKDDGTWRHVDAENKDQAEGKGSLDGEAVLSLERKIEGERSCRFGLVLVNNLPYEIRSFVPQFVAYRENGVAYDTVSANSAFAFLRPGDGLRRELRFNGINCKDIARVQVVGGDRCSMGDLNKWTEGKGLCLARVRVTPSDLVRFEK